MNWFKHIVEEILWRIMFVFLNCLQLNWKLRWRMEEIRDLWTVKEFIKCFHQFISRIFSTNFSQFEQLKPNFFLVQNSFFFLVCKLKQKYRKIFLKNCRIGIRVWWNYLMNLSFINISHFNNFMYNVHIHSSTWGLGNRFKPVVWKSIILNCHLLNCGTENRKSPTVLRDVHFTQGLLSQVGQSQYPGERAIM